MIAVWVSLDFGVFNLPISLPGWAISATAATPIAIFLAYSPTMRKLVGVFWFVIFHVTYLERGRASGN